MIETVRNRYFEWLIKSVFYGHEYKNYTILLEYLFSKPFYSLIDRDKNRACDGMSLRYLFSDEEKIDEREISASIDFLNNTCSVLEMMVALAMRIERMMSDPYKGNRTGLWFSDMLRSLGVIDMVNDNFDFNKVDHAINRFLAREYDKNGYGGLFVVNTTNDLTRVEIWYQAMWYLNDQ